ncbi:MAG: 50S ribosomal protein L6 [Candidatus Pacebacteria bacterium]|nr:50S ribosomal protein L6 [Candidatus Paceibacterota bacterium]
MSRLGKKPILIPDNVEVRIEKGEVFVKGPLGEIQRKFGNAISMKIEDKSVMLEPVKLNSSTNALWGTYASHVKNMIDGVSKGFSKELIIEGIGYRVQAEGTGLVFNIGFSHPVKMEIPKGISVKLEKNKMLISGIDKEIVGQTAATIRALKKPEPYKGKGIRYIDEVVRRKSGKKTGTTA